jgi:hypothetical protein
VDARVTLYVSSPDAEERVREAWKETLERSPMARTLARCVNLSLELQMVV